MRTTLRDLYTRLSLPTGGVATAAADLDDATPWYVTALAGFGTWVGAFLVGIAIALSNAFDDDGARLLAGLVLLALAPVFARLSKKAAATQAALIAVIAGEVLFVSGVDVDEWSVHCAIIIAMELYVIAAVNRPLTRAMATVAGLQALLLLLHELKLPVDGVVLFAGALGVTGFLFEVGWLNRPWSRLVRPVAAAALLSWLGFWTFEAITANFHVSRAFFVVAAPELHAFAGAAAVVAVAFWRGLRGLRLGGVAVVAVAAAALSLSLPGLVAAFVVTAVGVACRARLLTGIAVAFVLFFLWLSYWRLDVTLLDKALWSSAVGVLVLVVRAAVGRFVAGGAPLPSSGGARALRARKDARLTVVALVVFVAVIGGLVVDKEQTLAHGRRVLLPLQPRDPRSLAQGDYMALRTAVARDAQDAIDAPGAVRARFVVADVDANDVATFVHLGEEAGAGQVRLKLQGHQRDVRIGAEEMFFAEGDADRFSKARFGEVRVDDDGDVVLVGLCGEDRQPL